MSNNEKFNILLNSCRNPRTVYAALLALGKARGPGEAQKEGSGILPVPEEYANKPNLWRLACELSKFEDPEKALSLILAIAGPMLKKKEAQA